MKLIPDWKNKNLRCHICGNTKSVKYTIEILDPVVDNKPTTVYACNKCALRYDDKTIKSDFKAREDNYE